MQLEQLPESSLERARSSADVWKVAKSRLRWHLEREHSRLVRQPPTTLIDWLIDYVINSTCGIDAGVTLSHNAELVQTSSMADARYGDFSFAHQSL